MRYYYNKTMEHRVEHHICMEKSEPRRSFIRSDGLLYVLLLVGVVSIIVLGTTLSERYGWPRAYTQIALYAILIAIGIAVYRVRLMSFRYSLTDRMLTVDRIVGKKERAEAHVHLSDICRIRPCAALSEGEGGRPLKLCHGNRAAATAVTYRVGGEERTLLLGLSEEMKERLIAQWKTVRRS